MTTDGPCVLVLGAGPVATALAGALHHGGVAVRGLWARRFAAASAAAANAQVAAHENLSAELLATADVLLIAVRDDAICTVANMLADGKLLAAHHVLLHCSGALSARDAFSSVQSRIQGAGALHPLRAIPSGAAAVDDMSGTVFGVQGDEQGRRRAKQLVAAMGGTALELSGEQMAAYHAAAAVASNCLLALLDAAAELFEQAGIGRDASVDALLPLARGTLSNVEQHGIQGALTGPIRRGDSATVARHLAALKVLPKSSQQLYRALGLRLVQMCRTVGTPPEKLNAVQSLLRTD